MASYLFSRTRVNGHAMIIIILQKKCFVPFGTLISLLIRLYTVCHSVHQFLDISRGSKRDLFKFLDKNGKELRCPNTYAAVCAVWSRFTLFATHLVFLTLQVRETTFVVLEGYANSIACHSYYFTPDATIQSKTSAPIQEGIYFHINILLFIRKSGAGPMLIKIQYTEFQAVRNFSTHFVSYITIFW